MTTTTTRILSTLALLTALQPNYGVTVDVGLQIEAHTPYAQRILNDFVADHKQFEKCLTNQNPTEKEHASCLGLFEKLYAANNNKDDYKKWLDTHSRTFNKLEIAAQKDSENTASIKITGQVNAHYVIANAEKFSHLEIPGRYAAYAILNSLLLQNKTEHSFSQSTVHVNKIHISSGNN